ncbi:hypothetical protein IV203_019205 [Nitzschia inconspicua]|uniref:Uncharacterized protein n=1 Tax=Nitzschia inconspicua TaxID=303405 RepID=A0A9K3LZD6_9STRA|nr:hypothetical protein IV203_019205 [Nitzschia inconspicua]
MYDTSHSNSPAFAFAVAVVAGFRYFVVVFGIAFILGTIRSLFIAPRVGDIPAVLIETPIILTVSWKAMASILRTNKTTMVPDCPSRKTNMTMGMQDRLVMGTAAFAFLITAELILSVTAFGKTPRQFYRELTTSPPHVIGLVGQTAFGLFPLLDYMLKFGTNPQQQQAVRFKRV